MTKKIPGNEILDIKPFSILHWIDEALQEKNVADSLEEGDADRLNELYADFLVNFTGEKYGPVLGIKMQQWFVARIEKACADDAEKQAQADRITEQVTEFVEKKIQERALYLRDQKEIRHLEQEGYVTLYQMAAILGVNGEELRIMLIESINANRALGDSGIQGDVKIEYPGRRDGSYLFRIDLAEAILKKYGYKLP